MSHTDLSSVMAVRNSCATVSILQPGVLHLFPAMSALHVRQRFLTMSNVADRICLPFAFGNRAAIRPRAVFIAVLAGLRGSLTPCLDAPPLWGRWESPEELPSSTLARATSSLKVCFCRDVRAAGSLRQRF